MKIDEIKTIVKLMSEHDLTEFKIQAEECNLCIRRGCNTPAQIVTHGTGVKTSRLSGLTQYYTLQV